MSEAFDSQTMANTVDCQHQTTHKIRERRNGMGNIFEGVDHAVLEKLGLSEEIVHQLNPEGDETLTHCVSQIAEAVKSSKSLEKSRTHRPFSTIITEDMKLVVKKRGRRNAVGNLLELLSSPERLLLVEQLQEELARISIANDNNDDSADNTTDNSCDTDLESPPACSVARGPSATHGQIVCSLKITTVVCR